MPPPPEDAGTPVPTVPVVQTPKYLNSLFARRLSRRPLQQLHARLVLHGRLHLSALFGSRLAQAYFDVGSPREARKAFDQISSKNPRSWNTMLSGYFRSHGLSELLELYTLSRAQNHRPDRFSLAFGVRACTGLSLFRLGRSIHSEAIRSNLELGEFVSVPLVDMYVAMDAMEDAARVFDRAPLWSSSLWGLMMKGYLKASADVKVFKLFARMKELKLELNSCSAVCLARACGNIRGAKEGRGIHGFSLKKNFFDGNIRLQTSLVDMYGKSGMVDFAKRLFDEIPHKDVILWSSVIACLAQCGRAYESLALFREMLDDFVLPNEITLASVLLACSHLGALLHGKSVHAYIIRNDIQFDVVSETALLDMYCKCGFVELAYRIFCKMSERNVLTWSAMIGGFGMHGFSSGALELFERMKSEDIIPNSVTFVSVLSACSHSGKVEEGRHYFRSMREEYDLIPKDEHYSCMVDLLGRAGLFQEALSLIKKMPVQPGPTVWGALLGACKIHKQVDLANEVSSKVFVAEPEQPAAHVLLSNIYAAAETWDMVRNAREVINQNGLRKTVGFSIIEVDKRHFVPSY